MLHIILLILKIIGIVLLCILGVMLLTVCCVLFVPVRYRVEISREEGEGKPPVVVRAQITWMLQLVNILACYPADVYVRVRIFLFTLFRIPEAEHKKKTCRREKEKYTSEPKDAPSEDKKNIEDQISVRKDFDPEAESPEHESEEPAQEEAAGSPAGIINKIRNLLEKIKQILQKMKAAIENIQYTIRHFCDKMKSMLDNIQYYQGVIESEPFQNSWFLCRKQIGIILKELKPDKFEADLIIGMDDPAATGKILAVCGILYPFFGQHVRVAGDFERMHVEGWVYIKGRIRAVTFLRIAVKVYLNKDVRTLIKLLKKEAV